MALKSFLWETLFRKQLHIYSLLYKKNIFYTRLSNQNFRKKFFDWKIIYFRGLIFKVQHKLVVKLFLMKKYHTNGDHFQSRSRVNRKSLFLKISFFWLPSCRNELVHPFPFQTFFKFIFDLIFEIKLNLINEI